MSQRAISPHSNNVYTVGWIANSASDTRAATVLLDEEHGTCDPIAKSTEYTLGRLGAHMVVIVDCDNNRSYHMPKVLKKFKATFKNLRVLVNVGTAAGLPSYHGEGSQGLSLDIRLGDIIVGHNKDDPDRSLLGFGSASSLIEPVTAFSPPFVLLLSALDRLDLESELDQASSHRDRIRAEIERALSKLQRSRTFYSVRIVLIRILTGMSHVRGINTK
ncbi:hypothetical protein BJX99DRAFT_254045 [Aspergillus californicus]